MKPIYPDEFCQIPRLSNFHVFQGDGCPMTPKDKIVYENPVSWEMTRVKFMGYDLNLNCDEIYRFKPKSDLNEGGHVARCGPYT